MIGDGERLKQLVSEARDEVLLCAPFIKRDVLENLIALIHDRVKLTVVTRWKAPEVAAGVSDLSVYELINDRESSNLKLLDELHAKLYIADDHALVGSANLTGKALGWSPAPNIEILIDTPKSTEEVQTLLQRLAGAKDATYAIKQEIQRQADALGHFDLAEGASIDPDNAASKPGYWLPQCGAPERLFGVYRKMQSGLDMGLSVPAEIEAVADLEALVVPIDLSEAEFRKYVGDALSDLPGMKMILEGIPGTLSDKQGVELIGKIYPDYQEGERQRQWEIVREWIHIFFGDQFEVAPSSFVVRLKSKKG